eukprot:scaffold774_cov248-Pinguiococcus_pyrenoidosus.AAC.11
MLERAVHCNAGTKEGEEPHQISRASSKSLASLPLGKLALKHRPHLQRASVTITSFRAPVSCAAAVQIQKSHRTARPCGAPSSTRASVS